MSNWKRSRATVMHRTQIPKTPTPDDLSPDELSVVLGALWLWREQLGRVGSGQPIPGLASAQARQRVDEIARKLGGDPDRYFFGVAAPRGDGRLGQRDAS